MVNNILHAISHWFGWNKTRHATAFDEKGYLWEGRECESCGVVSNKRLYRERTLNVMSAFLGDRFGGEVTVTDNQSRDGVSIMLKRGDLAAKGFVLNECLHLESSLNRIAEVLEQRLV